MFRLQQVSFFVFTHHILSHSWLGGVSNYFCQRAGLAAVLVFYNVQSGTEAQLKN